jgi:hypothetical protein
MTAPARDGLSVVLAVRTSADPAPLLNAWTAFLPKCGRAWELVVVADGVSVPDRGGVTVLRHETPKGYGACVRTALPALLHPLVLLTADDYPYTPADLAKLIERIETAGEMPDPKTGEWGMRTPDLVAGARTGVPEPGLLKVGGAAVRAFCKIVLDLPLEPRPGWYGWGEHRKVTGAWLTYGVPLHDPHCGLKLVRKSLLERFPIQCDGDLFHVELVAKATFLACMMDEVPLTPKPDRVTSAVWAKADRKVLWGKPKFVNAVEPPATKMPPELTPASPEGATGNS